MSGRSDLPRLVLVAVVLAVLTRLIGLGGLPPALNRDEAAIGYNAYSLLKTGRDEHRQSWPMSFKSIGDYKMPGYIYAAILPVKIFGLNDWSIRFWSAIAGIISVVMIYLITKKPLAAMLMALNPWAIFYSRIGFEANLALALFLSGLWLLLRKNFWGYLFWLLAAEIYSSSLIFIPLFLAAVIVWLKPKLLPTLLFITAFMAIFMRLWVVSSQKANVTIFNDPATIDSYNQTRTAVYAQNPLLARTWWNKYIYFGRVTTVNYVKTFSPQFLLTRGGGHPWHQIPNMGYFYLAEIILAIGGLIFLFKTKHPWRWWLLAWLLISPLPSAITIDAPHATRSLHLLPVIIILASFGIPKKKWLQNILMVLYLANLSFFSYQYIVNYPKEAQETLPVGLKESLEFVKSKNISGKIYLTNIHDSTYLYPLIYTGFDPLKFQQEAVWTVPDTAGLTNAYKFSNYTIVDSLNDIVNPAAVILPVKIEYAKEPIFTSGNYKVVIY